MSRFVVRHKATGRFIRGHFNRTHLTERLDQARVFSGEINLRSMPLRMLCRKMLSKDEKAEWTGIESEAFDFVKVTIELVENP